MTRKSTLPYVVDTYLGEQWNTVRNMPYSAESTTVGSSKKVWWRCDKGHDWPAVVNNRFRKTVGCPVCSNQLVVAGVNDLATTHPTVSESWHPTRNGDLLPSMITAGNSRVVWWFHHGHEWVSSVKHRVNKIGCGVCRGTQIQVGVNDLGATHPELAAQWHPTKNQSLRPEDVYAGVARKVWWLTHGHEWEATIKNRTGVRQAGCGVCHGKAVQRGVNDLETLAAALAAEWHPAKNDGLAPHEVTLSTHRSIWWLCAQGHEWRSRPNNRWDDCLIECTTCSGVGKSEVASRFVRLLCEALSVDIEEERAIAVCWARRANIPATVDGYGKVDGMRFAVEYDGPWHQGNEEVDLRKTAALLGHPDVDVVVRVRDHRLELLPDSNPSHLQFLEQGRRLAPLALEVAASLKRFQEALRADGWTNPDLSVG